MPALTNPKHEAFAQARFRGQTADAAFVSAGYHRNRGNAARLNAKESVARRIAELTKAAAARVVATVSFDAKSMFERLEAEIKAAGADGNHNAVMKGREMMLQSFGYLDSPTLTHEHVRGQKIDQGVEQGSTPPTIEHDAAEAPRVMRFEKTLRELKKRLGQTS